MINCVRFSAIEEHLRDLGFTAADQTAFTRTFERGSDEFTIRGPNVDWNLPETLVNDAFSAAGLAPPMWDVFRCD